MYYNSKLPMDVRSRLVLVSYLAVLIDHFQMKFFLGQCNKQILLINITGIRNPTGWRQTCWLLTSVAEGLNSALPRTNTSWWSEQGLNPRLADFKSNSLTTWPLCLLYDSHKTKTKAVTIINRKRKEANL